MPFKAGPVAAPGVVPFANVFHGYDDGLANAVQGEDPLQLAAAGVPVVAGADESRLRVFLHIEKIGLPEVLVPFRVV